MAELSRGDAIVVVMRGVADAEKIGGEYTTGKQGGVRLPLLKKPAPAVGMSPAGFARFAETAYQVSGVYTNPAIEVVAKKDVKAAGVVVIVGGKVKQNRVIPFRDGMAVIQAFDGVGGRDNVGGRNLLLIRKGREYGLDFKQLAKKNIKVKAGDSLRVEAKPALIDAKGDEEKLKPLLGE